MKVLKYKAPRQAEIIEEQLPEITNDTMLCRSLFCSISAGTEMGFYRGTAPQLNCNNDCHNNFNDCPGAISYPMQANTPGVWWMGYANVSRVEKTGADINCFKAGDLIFSQRGHCEYHLLKETDATLLPENCNCEQASLTALIEIAYNGILDAAINLGETVVIFGMGPVGQLLMQMAKLSGAKTVVVDALPGRLELAAKSGADLVINFRELDVTQAVYDFTEGRGADVVIEASGNIAALTSAGKVCCYNGRLVVLSFYQQGADSLYLGREFHHKRLRLISSQICGFNPELGQRWDGTRRRKTAVELLSKLQLADLISSKVPFKEVPAALAMIDRDPASCNAVIIEY